MRRFIDTHTFKLLFIIVFGLSFILYSTTLPHTFVAVGDAAEYAVAILTHGIPHPPGYPLFVLLGSLTTLIPFMQNKLLLINSTSAVYGGLTCWLVALFIYRFTKSFASSLFAGFTLATSYLFWKYSSVSEVFTLNTFLSLLLLYLAFTLKSRRGFMLLICILGLTLANHFTGILLLPAVMYILWRRYKLPPLKELILYLPFLLIGLLPYLYFLWAGQQYPLMNWENPANVSGVIHLFLRHAYGTFHLAAVELPTPTITQQIVDFIEISIREYSLIGILLFIVGGLYLLKYRYHAAVAFLMTYFLTGIGFILLAHAPLGNLQLKVITERFLILPFVFFTIFIGLGHYYFVKTLQDKIFHQQIFTLFLAICFLGLPIYLEVGNYPEVKISQNNFAKNLADDILVNTPQNAVLLVTGDAKISSLIYAREVEGKRKDVAIIIPSHFDQQRRSWYLPLLKHHFPQVVVPHLKDDEGEVLTDFINENLQFRPVVCACGFLRERVHIGLSSKTVGLIEQFYQKSPEGVELEDIELENDALFKTLHNVNPLRNFPLSYIESDILREYAYPYTRLAHIYLQNGSLDKAERLYRKSLTVAPAFYRLYRNLAVIYDREGKRKEAVAVLKKYLELNSYDDQVAAVKSELIRLEKLVE